MASLSAALQYDHVLWLYKALFCWFSYKNKSPDYVDLLVMSSLLDFYVLYKVQTILLAAPMAYIGGSIKTPELCLSVTLTVTGWCWEGKFYSFQSSERCNTQAVIREPWWLETHTPCKHDAIQVDNIFVGAVLSQPSLLFMVVFLFCVYFPTWVVSPHLSDMVCLQPFYVSLHDSIPRMLLVEYFRLWLKPFYSFRGIECFLMMNDVVPWPLLVSNV